MQPDHSEPLTERFRYAGLFRLSFLRPNERVGAAGDRSGACVIESDEPRYELRIGLGETIVRSRDGRPQIMGGHFDAPASPPIYTAKGTE